MRNTIPKNESAGGQDEKKRIAGERYIGGERLQPSIPGLEEAEPADMEAREMQKLEAEQAADQEADKENAGKTVKGRKNK